MRVNVLYKIDNSYVRWIYTTYIYYKSHKWIYECELEKFKIWISNIKGKQVIFKVSKTLKNSFIKKSQNTS